ncbi:MAG TPA: TIGR03016 family PEP-CTERM system-associated outer membrane protein [Accumulibacter sp.]|nr:TIGR03016 family PEP-CTERM system-associated outer membrane protein [Accumulibacter sp.]
MGTAMATVTAVQMVRELVDTAASCTRKRKSLLLAQRLAGEKISLAFPFHSVSAFLLGLTTVGVASTVHAEAWVITPTLAVNETLTNNLFLSAANRTSDLVTEIAPGISIDGKSARASLRLDYSMIGKFYAHESSSNTHQNSLNAVGMLEAIENWLFIDASGTISQQYLSPFGPVSPSTANVNSNQTETSSYSLSPYIKGRFLSSADYLLRYKGTTTSSKSNAAADLTSSEWLGKLNGTTRWGALGWFLDANNLISNYSSGKDFETTSYNAGLSYTFNPQLRVSAHTGRESNNYLSTKQESNSTSGVGFVWTPSPRAELSANESRRFFGNGYDVSFRYRLPRSLVTYRASKDVSFQPSGVGNTSLGSNYDIFYSLLKAVNPGATPAAIKAQTIQLLNSRGIPLDGTVASGNLSNSPNVSKLQELTLAFLGARNTVTFSASEIEQQPLSTGASPPGGSPSLQGPTQQRAMSLVWGHQLTGASSLSLSYNHQRTRGLGDITTETTTDGVYLLLTTRISPKTQGNITARRVVADGASAYTESALTGGFSHSF